jgi:hypothetical protein
LFAGEKMMTATSSTLWHENLSDPKTQLDVKAIARQTNTVLFCNPRRKCIMAFGSALARELALSSVAQLIAGLDANNRQVTIPIPPSSLRPLLNVGLIALKEFTGATKLTLNLADKSLVACGDSACIELLQIHLAEIFGIEPSSSSTLETTMHAADFGNAKKAVQLQECPICMWTVGSDADESSGDEEAVVTLSCSHAYCRSCFEMWIAQCCSGDSSCGSLFPLKCYVADCHCPMSLRDISRCLSAADRQKLQRSAFDEFIRSHTDAYQNCLSPDCDNVFALGSERVMDCSCCKISYCMNCKVVEHEGLTCNENKIENSPPHVDRIYVLENIFTLKCPRCSKAFLDFEGCFSIKCSSCPCHFCGWCLKDCQTDAHPHVLICDKSLNKNNYFGTESQFQQVSRVRIIAKLKEYLQPKSLTVRQQIVSLLSNDLKDLGITVASVL